LTRSASRVGSRLETIPLILTNQLDSRTSGSREWSWASSATSLSDPYTSGFTCEPSVNPDYFSRLRTFPP
jgi:hypothetical protein